MSDVGVFRVLCKLVLVLAGERFWMNAVGVLAMCVGSAQREILDECCWIRPGERFLMSAVGVP